MGSIYEFISFLPRFELFNIKHIVIVMFNNFASRFKLWLIYETWSAE